MNYLLLTEYFPESENAEITGGVESRCFHLVKELAKKHKVIILCSHQSGQSRKSNIFSAEIIRCGPTLPYSNKGNIIKRLIFASSLYLAGKKLPSQNIVEGESFLTYPAAYFLGKRNHAKKIATWHETWVGSWIKNKGIITGSFGTIWERFSLRLKWDKIITVSNFTRESLIKLGQNSQHITVIPNGINFSLLSSISSEKHPSSICYFGRLNWQKNLDVLIRAVAEVKKEIPSIQLNLIGGGPASDSLKKLTRELNLSSQIHFLGPIPNYQQYLQEAAKAQIFISPSTMEGFGITVIEAMALGMPVVITDIPPFVEITHNGNGAEIFPAGDSQVLAQKIILLLKNKKHYALKCSQAKKLASEYDWQELFNNYLEKLP